MIAKIAIPVILAILLANIYFTCTSWRGYKRRRPMWKWLLLGLAWLLPVLIICQTVRLALIPDYFPADVHQLNNYLTLLCVYTVPAVLVALCSLVGRLVKHRSAGTFVGWTLSHCAVQRCPCGYLCGRARGHSATRR